MSVEAVNGYLDAIRACKCGDEFEGKALLELSNKVHPLVLGQIFRSRQQIRDLARRLLTGHTNGSDKIEEIIDFLCSESGSHDYTINRREARDLGLNIENCTADLYEILRTMRQSYSTQMQLREPYDPNVLAEPGHTVQYNFTRALIESTGYGEHHFVSEGHIEAVEQVIQDPSVGSNVRQITFRDRRRFEGWRKVE